MVVLILLRTPLRPRPVINIPPPHAAVQAARPHREPAFPAAFPAAAPSATVSATALAAATAGGGGGGVGDHE